MALPAQGKTLSTAEPPAAVAGSPAGPAGSQRGAQAAQGGATALPRNLRFVVSRTRPPAFVQSLADRAGAVLLPLGSAGAKAATVICGDADAYIHSGGQYEWDSAAPVAVARAAGLHAKLAYNQEHPWMPDILICLAPLAGPLLEAIAVAGGAGE